MVKLARTFKQGATIIIILCILKENLTVISCVFANNSKTNWNIKKFKKGKSLTKEQELIMLVLRFGQWPSTKILGVEEATLPV